jgi:hypothetical protein
VAFSLLVAVIAGSCVSRARADVELKDEEREHLGIQTEPVRLMEAPRSWPAAASVVDVSTLIASLSDLQAAESAAAASAEEAQRTETLYHEDKNVSRKTLDAARTQAITDQGRVTTTRGQLLSSWGRSIASLSAPAHRQLVTDLLAGHVSLVRAEPLTPAPADAPITEAQLKGLNGGNWSASMLGPLPQAAGAPSTQAFLLRVGAALPAGQPLQATLLEGKPTLRGPTVSAAAIVRWHGQEWVYEETAKNHFVRHAVRGGPRIAGRALIEGDVAADQPVVIVGARALLAAELGASAPHESDEED